MKNIEVVSKRVSSESLSGIACGPVCMDVACAEMVIKDDGKIKYLTLCWVSEAAETLEFDITDMPIYEYLIDGDISEDDMVKLSDRRGSGDEYIIESTESYDGPYVEPLKELAKMVANALKDEDFLDEDSFEYQDDVWAWLTELAGESYNLPTYEEEELRLDQEYGEDQSQDTVMAKAPLYELSRKIILDSGKTMYAAGMMLPDNIHLLAVRYYDNVIWFYVEHEDQLKVLNERFPDVDEPMEYWVFVNTITDGNPGKRYLGLEQAGASVYSEYFNKLNAIIDSIR